MVSEDNHPTGIDKEEIKSLSEDVNNDTLIPIDLENLTQKPM